MEIISHNHTSELISLSGAYLEQNKGMRFHLILSLQRVLTESNTMSSVVVQEFLRQTTAQRRHSLSTNRGKIWLNIRLR